MTSINVNKRVLFEDNKSDIPIISQKIIHENSGGENV